MLLGASLSLFLFATNSGDSISTRALEKSAALAPRSLRHHQTLRSVPGAWQGCLRTHVGVQGVRVCAEQRLGLPCMVPVHTTAAKRRCCSGAGAAPVLVLLVPAVPQGGFVGSTQRRAPRGHGRAVCWGHAQQRGWCPWHAPHPCLGTTAVLGGSLVRKAAAFGQLEPAAPSLLTSCTLKASSLPTFLPPHLPPTPARPSSVPHFAG